MNQNEKRLFLINELLNENKNKVIKIPAQIDEQKMLLRALMNVRQPSPISSEFLKVQDEYLQNEILEKGIVNISDIKEIKENIYLWQGDITRLATSAIVNAANSGLTGCYQPNHNCIDNCIHTFAGLQLRLECAKIIKKQGHEEGTGFAKITCGYNLPCKYIIHTVGPVVYGTLLPKHCEQLASSYKSSLEIADEYNCTSIAFCCISTGVFSFPNEKAAEIAVQTVMDYKKNTASNIKIIFNVFKDNDYDIYKKLLR